MDSYALADAIVVTPRKIRSAASLLIQGGKVAGFGRQASRSLPIGSASVVYPALVNIHDHLRGNYLPPIGPPAGTFYTNWSAWDVDLKSSPAYQERSAIDIGRMYLLGAYKNLFSGVGTVNDHFPHELNGPHIGGLPIRVIAEYCLAHECSSFDLKWGDGMEIEHARAKERNWPFITHLEEGFDPESQDGVGILERAGILDEFDVLIHCIGFSDEDIRKVKKAQATVAWCPASNFLMFNATCKIRKLLRAGVNVALGTDSTHTGSTNLLAEMKYARMRYRDLYGEELPAKTLYDMVSSSPAKALRMEGKVGVLEPGASADIAVFRARHEDPYENLCAALPEDLELLTIEGKPVYGDEARFGSFFADEIEDFGHVTVGGRRMFAKGDPLALYRGIRASVGFAKQLDYLPFEP